MIDDGPNITIITDVNLIMTHKTDVLKTKGHILKYKSGL